MLLIPSHSIRQYYSQNIARMFIFLVNLTVHGFGGGTQMKSNLEDLVFRCHDIKIDFKEIS